ncbi:DUF559 domain-containing protein [Corynebacterium breve]|uniref:DUF559 domain-containing protein n=1 Tax=Corynebacterium breve TaxID=3049799 RepID=A0ABY8VD08_9CORY|nr:DUF559 domain-containing protein [Corynebacterium breve]WIM67545.1 DUF559 domain-containing protein [Corynebacterium breve]
MNNKDVYSRLAHSLINLRAVPNSNRDVWKRVSDGELIRLASCWVISRELFAGLKMHHRRWVTAFAHGCNTNQAVLAGRSAARILGMWVITRGDEPVELILPSGHLPAKKKWPKGTIYRRSTLDGDEIRQIGPVRTTHPIRTALDIARLHGFREGLVACDDLLRRGYTKQELRRELAQMGKRKGSHTAKRCIAAATRRSDSPFESYARALLIEAGIGGYTLQKQIGKARVDMCFENRLIIEIDGEENYNTNDTIIRERHREKQLTNQGFRVLRYHPQDLLADPDAFIDQVLHELTHAAA